MLQPFMQKVLSNALTQNSLVCGTVPRRERPNELCISPMARAVILSDKVESVRIKWVTPIWANAGVEAQHGRQRPIAQTSLGGKCDDPGAIECKTIPINACIRALAMSNRVGHIDMAGASKVTQVQGLIER